MTIKTLFNSAVIQQNELIKLIDEKLSKKFKLKNEDTLNIYRISLFEGCQSDCDGYDSYILCDIELFIKSKSSKLMFTKILTHEKYQCYDIHIHNMNHILFGTRYTFKYKLYI